MSLLLIVTTLLLALVATGVVMTRDLLYQAILFGLFGQLLAALFLLLHAPGVALAQAVVSGLFLPLLILLSIAKVGRAET
jgi:multicomponent Na+:H+ antiporter subunit B